MSKIVLKVTVVLFICTVYTGAIRLWQLQLTPGIKVHFKAFLLTVYFMSNYSFKPMRKLVFHFFFSYCLAWWWFWASTFHPWRLPYLSSSRPPPCGPNRDFMVSVLFGKDDSKWKKPKIQASENFLQGPDKRMHMCTEPYKRSSSSMWPGMHLDSQHVQYIQYVDTHTTATIYGSSECAPNAFWVHSHLH